MTKYNLSFLFSLILFLATSRVSCFENEQINWEKGKVYRVAGTGKAGYTGDNGPAIRAQLNGPAGLAIDKNDNIYVADLINCAIRKIDSTTKIISTVVGCGERGYAGDGGSAIKAKLNRPEGIFVDNKGDLYIADSGNHRIRKVEASTGIIKTIAGNGKAGFEGDDDSASKARLNHPAGVVVDSKGNVYVNDYGNDRIRKINRKGIITTYAGTGMPGYTGDGGPAIRASINDVYGLAIDKADNIYLIDSLNFAVRRVDSKTQIISTVVGKGRPGQIIDFILPTEAYLGGKPHIKGTIGSEVPHALDVDCLGNIFIADTGVKRIRMIDIQRNLIFTVAGNGVRAWSGDDGPAKEASLEVHGLRIDSRHRLFFVDFHHHLVRMIDFPLK
jgi:hypothetical protein